MRNIHFLSGIIVLLTISAAVQAQYSMIPIFESSTEFVKVFEKEGYDIVNLNFDIVSNNELSKDTRLTLSSGNEYLITAFGDELKLKNIKLELFDVKNNKWEFLKAGEPIKDAPNSSLLTVKPNVTQNYLIKITALEFMPDSKDGRFVFVTGSRPAESGTLSEHRETLKYVKRTNKFSFSNYEDFTSTFKLDLTNHYIIQSVNGSEIKYKVIEKTSKKEDEAAGKYLYDCEAVDGTPYLVKIDIIAKQIFLIKFSNQKEETGYLYYLSGDIFNN